MRKGSSVSTSTDCLGDRRLPDRERLAQAIDKGGLALGRGFSKCLGIANAALIQPPEHLGRQGRERLPVCRLLETLDARGGLLYATSAELLHGF